MKEVRKKWEGDLKMKTAKSPFELTQMTRIIKNAIDPQIQTVPMNPSSDTESETGSDTSEAEPDPPVPMDIHPYFNYLDDCESSKYQRLEYILKTVAYANRIMAQYEVLNQDHWILKSLNKAEIRTVRCTYTIPDPDDVPAKFKTYVIHTTINGVPLFDIIQAAFDGETSSERDARRA